MYEGAETQVASIRITRTGDVSGASMVAFTTTDGSATGGAACGGMVDYIDADQDVSFIANQTVAVVNVSLCGDQPRTDLDETVMLAITGANVGTPNTATLKIIDTAHQFVFSGPIAIDNNPPTIVPEGVTPYPAPIVVAGQPNIIGSMRVTLFNYSHTMPDNVDVLLVGPLGQKFILMSKAGGLNPIDPLAPVTLSLTDVGGVVLPDNGPLTGGNREPTSWVPGVANFPGSAPLGPYNEPGSAVGGTGTQTFNGNFGGTNPNGTWNLFVRQLGGGTGLIANGWGLEFISPTAAGASISGRVLTADGRPIRNATLTVTGNSLTTPLRATTGSFGYYSFDGLTVGETYVITVTSKRFTFQVPSRVISLVDNIADADFIAADPATQQ